MDQGRQVFSVDLLERYASKNRGMITCMAAGNDVIVLGTSKGWIIRHDFGVGSSYDIDLSVGRTGEQSIHKVFVDPGGSHCIATVTGVGGAETFYTHAKWPKPRVLSRLKGLLVNSVAWNRQQITEVSTKEIILGTQDGQLFEMAVDEKDKREKYIKFLFELEELPEAFMALQMETANINSGMRYYVMAVTPTRLYSFTGIGTLESVFASYKERAVHFMELPGEIPNSELHFFIKQRRAVHFAWLSGTGIYHGGLNFGAQHSYPNGDENFVESKALLDYSKLSDGTEIVKPSSMALSEYHFLLLIGNKVKVVNRISEQIIEELQFDITADSASRGIIGLCSDASAGLFYAYDQNSIFQVSVIDEGRDMWKVYLDLKVFAAALANCRDPLQRDQVYLVQAEAAFADKEYLRAASFYAKVISSSFVLLCSSMVLFILMWIHVFLQINYVISFEEVTLKFISINEPEALRTFLLRKLDTLSKDDKCQITMISTWATELYLDKINRLLLEDDTAIENRNSEYHSVIQEFRAFMSDCKDVLDEATTMKLLESYGRVEELVYFANLKEQYEIVIHHYIQQGEAKKALEVLQKSSVSDELQYKFAPELIMLDAYETVEAWMASKNLNPRRLITAMMRYSSEPHAKNETHEVIKYLEFCVHSLHNEDPGIHNLLLSLYAKQEDDSALLRFLQCKFGKGRENGPEFFYDPKYALRLCLKEKRTRACVHIYSMMSMHEEAVALALQIDPELAMAEADKVEDDEDLRKKLWLMVAKHVVKQEKGAKRENIRKAIAFLKETDGLLKIEDILPFFPDFALIDDFKEAICSSLEDYNKQIEQLKEEMNDATRGADNIRNDISALTQRYAVIDREEECGVCKRKILTMTGDFRMAQGYSSSGPLAPFYVFPCGHSFHAQCLITHVTSCAHEEQAEHILDLQKQLTLLGSETRRDMNGNRSDEPITSTTTADKLRSELDDAIASECPFCGELMINEITLPFIKPEETRHSASWDLRPQTNLANQRTISLPV
ncbi:vacuolar sorting protein 18 isoform X1 [Brassica napus]|uniref:vacuolar sorting protein 18 isoform X1 n=1 Tax=Brassica napus TaxID=3708 RepID=UPI002078C25B|nr:vacuolar sorting protein 18 isoform X1 [Brassica napus]XP_048638190.1 vacuolar sorting protein 18 isoform X1 [Brassica napus]